MKLARSALALMSAVRLALSWRQPTSGRSLQRPDARLSCIHWIGCCTVFSGAFAADCPTNNCPPSSSQQTLCPLPTADVPERHGIDPAAPVTLDVKHWFLDAAGSLDLTGGVELRQGERVMRAPEMHGDSNGNWTIPGKVELADPNLIVSGQGAQAATTAGTADFETTTFELPARFGHGSASHIRLSQDGAVNLRDVRYTTCPGPKPDWELKASQLNIDGQASSGTARNVQLYFKGVQIFPIPFVPVPFPYFSFPVGNERKTGMLAPSFGQSSSSGWELSAPVYWNIAPNYDATITPTWYTERGIDLGTKFRFLTEQSHGEIDANYLPYDQRTGEQRGFAELHDQTDFTTQLRLNIDASRVSDDEWLEDFGSGAQRIGVVVLPRAARMAYRSTDWSITALVQNYQAINPARDPLFDPAINPVVPAKDPNYIADPYTLLPQLNFRGWFPDRWGSLGVGLIGEYSHFRATRHSTELQGQRLDFTPEVRLPLRHNGFYLEPAATWRYTAYHLDRAVAVIDSDDHPPTQNPTRSAPVVSVDSGVVFERFTGHKQRRIQTLEPRVLYLYVPYRDQSNLPVFDTTQSDFNLIQLYNTNRYSGPDRLGDANQVAIGVTSRLLDSSSGTQYMSATLGEVYRFATQCVTLPSEPRATSCPEHRYNPALTPPSGNLTSDSDLTGNSDLIGELRLGEYKNWNAGIGVQWDPNADALQRTEISVQYIPGAGRVLNGGYVYRKAVLTDPQQPDLNQIDLSVAWPIGNRVNVFAHYVFSLDDEKTPNDDERQTLDALAGVEYHDCCWGFRFGARRVVNSSGNLETVWQWQVELNGLADVGSASDAFLSQAIRGYSASRFDRRSVP